MPNLFTSLGRAALVALGLSIAPVALAQGTLSCPTGFTPLVNGNEVTCQMACATGTPTPTINGGSVSFTCSTGGGDAAPGGCTLTSSAGTTIPAGGTTTLTAKCTTGSPTDLTLTWTTPSGTASCPQTGTVNQNATCQVTGIQQGGTWSVKFGNGVGNDVTRTLQYGMQSGGGGDYANCPTGTLTSSSFYPVTNTGNTMDIGALYDGKWMVIKVVPSTSSTSTRKKSAFFGTSYSPDPNVQYSLSTKACDLSDANALSHLGRKVKGNASSDLTFEYSYGASGGTYNGYPVSMIRGQTYYLNIYTTSGCPDNGVGCWYTNSSFE